MPNERKDVVCKCGRFFGSRSRGAAGYFYCPSCGNRVHFQVTDNNVYVSYVKR